MEGSPENRERRTGVVLGVLATLVLALGIALGIVLASDDGGGSDDPDVTAPATSTQPTDTVTVTQPPSTTATTTTPTVATITQPQAKAAAARGASEEAEKGGISFRPSDWDVRCTAAGGGPRATRWTCPVASSNGQCAGSIVAYARGPDVAATTDPRIACGE